MYMVTGHEWVGKVVNEIALKLSICMCTCICTFIIHLPVKALSKFMLIKCFDGYTASHQDYNITACTCVYICRSLFYTCMYLCT